MKRVPAQIKRRLQRIAKLNKVAEYEMRLVEFWIENEGLDLEELRRGDGCSLVEFEYGIDITEEFCKKIEAMYAERTNKS